MLRAPVHFLFKRTAPLCSRCALLPSPQRNTSCNLSSIVVDYASGSNQINITQAAHSFPFGSCRHSFSEQCLEVLARGLEWSLLQMLELDAHNFAIYTDMPHDTPRTHRPLLKYIWARILCQRFSLLACSGRQVYSEVDARHWFYSVHQCLSFLGQFPHSHPFSYYYYQLGFP